MFCRTQWPSPEEYSQLEVQTSLGRTDIVRWFKDHRSALKNGETLDWMEGFQNHAEQHKADQEQNGQSSEKNQSISLEVEPVKGTCRFYKGVGYTCLYFCFLCFLNATSLCVVEEAAENTAAAEHSKLPEQDKVQWLTDRLAHGVTDLCRTKQDQTSPNTVDKGR